MGDDERPGEPPEDASASTVGPGARQPPPGYLWVHVPPPPEMGHRSRRRMIIVATAWGAVLVVAAVVYAFHGTPTVREQTTISSAQPRVDAAIANVVAAAGSGPIAAISGFEQVRTCSVTLARQGAEYQRTVDFYAAPGTESALMHTIAAGLPGNYKATAGPGDLLHLDADAGDFVGLVGSAPFPGDVQVRAETGCRPLGSIAPRPVPPAIGAAEMAPVRAVLAALGTTATSTSAAQVPCASGPGMLRTVTARAPAKGTPDTLSADVAALAPQPATATDGLVAYRSGATDVVVTQDSSGLMVAATTGCR